MQILSEQRLNEIMSVFKFFGSIANDHRLPLPNQQTGEDSYSSNLYSTFSRTPPARARFIGSFRFFSEKFAALLILLLRATAKNEGIPEDPEGPALIFHAASRHLFYLTPPPFFMSLQHTVAEEIEVLFPGILQRGFGLIEGQSELRHYRVCPR